MCHLKFGFEGIPFRGNRDPLHHVIIEPFTLQMQSFNEASGIFLTVHRTLFSRK